MLMIEDNIAAAPGLAMKTIAGSYSLAESQVKKNARVVDLVC